MFPQSLWVMRRESLSKYAALFRTKLSSSPWHLFRATGSSTAHFGAFTAVGTAFATFFADKATAQRGKTAMRKVKLSAPDSFQCVL